MAGFSQNGCFSACSVFEVLGFHPWLCAEPCQCGCAWEPGPALGHPRFPGVLQSGESLQSNSGTFPSFPNQDFIHFCSYCHITALLANSL